MKRVRQAAAVAALACMTLAGTALAQAPAPAPAPPETVAPAPAPAPAPAAPGQNAVVRESSVLAQIEEQFVNLGDKVRQFVVNIDATGKLESPDGGEGMEGYEDIFKYFFNIPNMPNAPNMPPGGQPMPFPRMPLRPPVASGSGFIYDAEGHIITNNHVVEGAAEITVRLTDGREFPAEVVGTDPDTDVAVIKITPDGNLPVAPLGDSGQLKVGQFAIAAGSPRGLEGSISFGHISALGRRDLNLGPSLRFQDFIQTDAAINLGNSGGPLCNIQGQVVGINTAIVYGAQSLGFAIPINTAKTVVPQLIERGKVVRGYLGVMVSNADEFAEALKMPDKNGAFVQQVQPDTPAERAGLQAEDVIRKINGQVVEGRDDLVRMISEMAPGQVATLEVWRNGAPINLDVNLEEYEATAAEPQRPGGGASADINGIRVRPLSPEMREHLGVEADVQGVVITDIAPGSAAAEAGLQPGDIITRVAQQDVTTVAQFREVMEKSAKPGASLLIRTLSRGGDAVTRVLKVPAEGQGQSPTQ